MAGVDLHISGMWLTWAIDNNALSYNIYSHTGISIGSTTNINFNIRSYVDQGITGFYITSVDASNVESESSLPVWYIPQIHTSVSGDNLVWSALYNELDINVNNNILGIYPSPTGDVYITSNNKVLKYDTSGNLTLVAGSQSGASGYQDGEGTSALFNGPNGIVGDLNGNLFVCDTANNRIRKIDICGNVSTFAGDGTSGTDVGVGTAAQLGSPVAITIDSNGLLYATANYNIYSIDSSANVVLIAGNGTYGEPINDSGANAQFAGATSITVDASGNLYGTDFAWRVWKVDATPERNVTTLYPKDGSRVAASFGIAVNQGYIYYTDYGWGVRANYKVVRIDMNGDNPTTIYNKGLIVTMAIDSTGVFYLSNVIEEPYTITAFLKILYTSPIATFDITAEPGGNGATGLTSQFFPLNDSTTYIATASYQGSTTTPFVYSTDANYFESNVGSVVYTCNADGSYFVTGCSPVNTAHIVIDSSYNGGGVSIIAEYAFQWNSTLTSVSMLSITDIGQYAFQGCTSLTTPSMESVNTIGQYAFQGCTSLITPSIESVNTIGQHAFKGCTSIVSVSIPLVSSIPPSTFFGCTSLIDISMESVSTIELTAFQGCTSLSNVYIPMVSSIGDSAFSGCSSLTSIDMQTVLSIGQSAFAGCGLVSVSLPTIQYIGHFAFQSSSLQSIDLSSSAVSITLMDGCFAYCNSLKSAVIPSNVLNGYIAGIFAYCENLESVVIEEGIITLTDSAFRGTLSLSSVILPSTLTTIGTYCFYNTGLISITLPQYLSSLHYTAFGVEAHGVEIIYFEGLPPTIVGNTDLDKGMISTIYYPIYYSQEWVSYSNDWLQNDPSLDITFSQYVPSWYNGDVPPSAPANIVFYSSQGFYWNTQQNVLYEISANDVVLANTISISGGITYCTLSRPLLEITCVYITATNFVGSATSASLYIPTIFISSTNNTLEWSPVQGAEGYSIYSVSGSEPGSESYTLLDTVSTNAYIVSGNNGESISYVAIVVATLNGISGQSIYSNQETVYFVGLNTLILDTSNPTNIALRWESSNGYSYNVYMNGVLYTTITAQGVESECLIPYVFLSSITDFFVSESYDTFMTTTETYVPSPVASIDGDVVTWNPISDSFIQYTIYSYPDYQSIQEDASSPYTISGGTGNTSVVVVAIDTRTLVQSNYSNVVSIYTLSAPTNLTFDFSNQLLTWDNDNQLDVTFNVFVNDTMVSSELSASYSLGSLVAVSAMYVVALNGSMSSSPSTTVMYIPAPSVELGGTSLQWKYIQDTFGNLEYEVYSTMDLSNSLSRTSSSSYTILNVSSGLQTFFVVSVSVQGENEYRSSYSNEIIINIPSTPSNLTMTPFNGYCILSWDTLQYTSYILNVDGMSRKYNNIVSSSIFFNTSHITGTATMNLSVMEDAFVSPYSNSVTYVPPPQDVVLTITTLSWSAVSSIDTILYNIYSVVGESYTLIGTTYSTSYTVEGPIGSSKDIVVSAYDVEQNVGSVYSSVTNIVFPFVPADGTYDSSVIVEALQSTADISIVKDILLNQQSSFSSTVLSVSGSILTTLVESFSPGYSNEVLSGTVVNILLCQSGQTANIPPSSINSGNSIYIPLVPNSTIQISLYDDIPNDPDYCEIVYIDSSSIMINNTIVLLGDTFTLNGINGTNSGLNTFRFIATGSIFAIPVITDAPVITISGSALTWESVSGTDVVYTVYVASESFVVQDTTSNTSWDICASVYSEITQFALSATAATYLNSPFSNLITYVPPPSDVYIDGNTLNWNGPSNVTFTLYENSNVLPGFTGLNSLSVDLLTIPPVSTLYIVATDLDGNQSVPSESISIAPVPANVSIKGTIVTWGGPSDISYSIYDNGSMIQTVAGTSYDISSNISNTTMSITITSVNGYESTSSIPILYIPQPSSLSIYETTLSWTTIADVLYNVYVNMELSISDIQTGSVDISSVVSSTEITLFSIVAISSADGTSSEMSMFVAHIPAPIISLNGSLVSWNGNPILTYNIYSNGTLDTQNCSNPVDVSANTEITSVSITAFSEKYNAESIQSNYVIYVPPPTDITLSGQLLSWSSTVPSVSFTVNSDLSGIMDTYVYLSSLTDVSTLSVIAVSPDGSTSAASNTVLYVPVPTNISLSDTVLTWPWTGVVPVYFKLYATDYAGEYYAYSITSSTSVDVSNILLNSVSMYITTLTYDNVESINSNVLSVESPPYELTISGTVLSWSYLNTDVSFQLYTVDGGTFSLLTTLDSSTHSYSTNQTPDTSVFYAISVMRNEVESDYAYWTVLATPAVPSDLSATDSDLTWSSNTTSPVTFNIYRVNANGSYTMIGTSETTTFNIGQYGGIPMRYVVTGVSVSSTESDYSNLLEYTLSFSSDISGLNGSDFVAASLDSTATGVELKEILNTYQDSFSSPLFSVPASNSSKLVDVASTDFDSTKPVTVVLCKNGLSIDISASSILQGNVLYFAGVSGSTLTYNIKDDISVPNAGNEFVCTDGIPIQKVYGDQTIVVQVDDDSLGVTIAGVNYRFDPSGGISIPFGPNGIVLRLVGIGSWIAQSLLSFSFDISGDTARITGFNNSVGGILNIPATIEYNDNGDTKIASVVSVGNGLGPLTNASGVTMVVFDPSSVCTTIAPNAFSSFTNLSYIELPSSITTIGNNAFHGCTTLNFITFTSSLTSANSTYRTPSSTISNNDAVANAIQNSSTNGQSYGNPFNATVKDSSLYSIGENAFYGCINLTNADFNECFNLAYIGDNAFYNCSKLCATFASSLTSIQNSAFEGCNGSGSVCFSPMSLTSFGSKAFYGCMNLSGTLDLSNSSIETITDQFTDTATLVYPTWGTLQTALVSSLPDISNTIQTFTFRKDGIDFNNSLVITSDVFVMNILAPLYSLSSTQVSIESIVRVYSIMTGYGFPYLQSIRFSPNLVSISGYAFSACLSLKNILFPTTNALTSIGSYAFAYCFSLDISNSFTTCNNLSIFNDHAFFNCINVKSVYIPNSVSTIAQYTFGGCSSLNSIYISPSSNLITIGDYAFSSSNVFGSPFCTSLVSAQFFNCSQLQYIGAYAFAGCKNLLCQFPASITDISSGAFQSCDGSGVLVFSPMNLSFLGSNAFSNCTSLSGSFDLSHNSTITSIPSDVFSGTVPNLISCTISPSIQSLPQNLFNACTSFKTLYLNVSSIECVSNTLSTRSTFDTVVFTQASTLTTITSSVPNVSMNNGLSNIKYITLPDSLTTIAANTFLGCTQLLAVYVSANSQLTTIGSNAFQGCSSLAVAQFNNCSILATIGSQAFFQCSKLTALFSASITSIGSSAFSGCDGSGVLTFSPMSLTVFGSAAFSGCANLSGSLILSNSSIASITDQFGNNGSCRNLTSISLPNSLTTIGSAAFMNCTSLTSVLCSPSSQLASIGDNAFKGCSSLTTTQFNNCSSLATIGSQAFNQCSKLTALFSSSITSIGASAFSGCDGSGVLTFSPMSLTVFGSAAFSGCANLSGLLDLSNSSIASITDQFGNNGSCRNLTSISIPNSVATIGSSAFANCIRLSSVLLGVSSNLVSIGSNAFAGIPALVFNIPETVQDISDNAFLNVSSSATVIFKGLPPIVSASGALNSNSAMFGVYPQSLNAQWLPYINQSGRFRNLRMRSSQFISPVLISTLPVSPAIYNASSTVIVSLSGSPYTTYTLYVDGSLNQTGYTGSSSTTTLSVSNLADGSHNFYATLSDVGGNSESSSTLTIVVLATPPAAPYIDTYTRTYTYNNTQNDTILLTISGARDLSYTLYDVCNNIYVYGTIQSSSTVIPLTGFANKRYSFQARLINQAGVSSLLSNELIIDVDMIPPTKPHYTSTSPSITGSTTLAFTISGEQTSTYRIYMDTSTNLISTGIMTSPVMNVSVSGIVDGSHNFFVSLTDTAGNISVFSDSLSIEVYTVKPAAPQIITTSPTLTNLSSITFTVSGTSGTTYMFYVDSSLNSTGTMNPSGTVTVVGLTDGSHNFHATLVDSLGNVSINSSTRTIRVDTSVPRPPRLLLSLPRAPYTNSTSLLFTVSGDVNTVFNLYRNGTLTVSGTISTLGSSIASITGLSNDTYTFRANLTNAAGTTGPDCSNTIVIVDTIAPAAPTFRGSLSQTINSSSILLTLSGEVDTTYTLYVNGNSRILTGAMNPTGIVTVSGLVEGQNTFYARLTDAAGNNSAFSSTMNVVVDTISPDAPIFSSTQLYSNLSSVPFTISGSLDSTYIIYVDNVPSLSGTILSSPVQVSVILSDGSHSLYAILRDAAGNNSTTSSVITKIVDTINPLPPVFTPTPSLLTQTITVSGEIGTTYRISLQNGFPEISGTMIAGGVSYSYSNLLYTNSYTLESTLTDAAGNQSTPQSVTWSPPFTVSISGSKLVWNGPNATYSVYRVNTDFSTRKIADISHAQYDIGLYAGLTIKYRIYDSANINSNDLLVTISPSVYPPNAASISPVEYITAGLQSVTNKVVLKSFIDNNGAWFSSSMVTISGVNCSPLIDPSRCSLNYPIEYFTDKPFKFFFFTETSSPSIVDSDLPNDPSNILYLALPTSTNISWSINSDQLTLTAESNSLIVNVMNGASSMYGIGSLVLFGAITYILAAIGCIICIPCNVFTPINVILSGNVLSWTGSFIDHSYNVYDNSGDVLLGTTANTFFDVSSYLYPLSTYYIVGIGQNGTAFSSPSSVVSNVPPPTNLTASGSILYWNYPVYNEDLVFKLYAVMGSYVYILDIAAAPGSVNISFDTETLNRSPGIYTYVLSAVYNSCASSFSNNANVRIIGTVPTIPCFLGSAPVLTPKGYMKISKLSIGDKVLSADGRTVAIQKVSHTRVEAGPSVNPYIIPKGLYGATRRLLISPDHRVATKNGLVEAKYLGLEQENMSGTIDYYNIELPNWKNDNMVVAGVHVESMAPVRRITMTMAQFKAILVAKYGKITPDILAKIQRTCRILANGDVDCPVLIK